jgi:hypothetical protein
MSLPGALQVCDSLRECLVRVSKVYGGLELAAIGMQRIAMAESVGVIVTDDRRPIIGMQDFELDGEVRQSATTAAIRAAQANFIGDDVNQPGPDCDGGSGIERGGFRA